jgi:hypothetical protein
MDGVVGAHGRPVIDPDTGNPRCTADSKQKIAAGIERGSPEARCGRRPIPGGKTCVMHGSGTAAAVRAARLRGIDLTDPALTVVARILASDAEKASDRLRAAENILDRFGFPRNVDMSVDEVRDAILHALDDIDDDG